MNQFSLVLKNRTQFLLTFGLYFGTYLLYEYLSQAPGWVKTPRTWTIAGVLLLAIYGLELWYKSRPNYNEAPRLTAVSKYLPRIAALCLFFAILESR